LGLAVKVLEVSECFTSASGQIFSNVAFDNRATIIADPTALGLGQPAGTITLNGTGWSNDGSIAAEHGGTIVLQGTRTNLCQGTLTGPRRRDAGRAVDS
jgi:hypothetical protein